MRVLIHALGATMGGAQRHLAGFLPALAKAGRDHSFCVIVRTGLECVGSANVELLRVSDRLATNAVARTYFDNVSVPRLARQFRADAILSLMNLGPIRPQTPHIIMQRNALLFARKFWGVFPARETMRLRMQRFLAIACMRRANIIITPSDYMAGLIRNECRFLPAERFAVLPHAFAEPRCHHELNREFVDRLDSLRGPKILYPCLGGRHQAIDLLFEVARVMPESLDANLIVTGDGAAIGEAKQKAAKLGVDKKVVFLGRVPQQQMPALYRACDLMLYVSPIESFGFPLLEGLAFGLPIVAADTQLTREICGPAARYFKGDDPNAAARAMEEALACRGEMRAGNKRQFDSRDRTWDTYVHTLLHILESEIRQDELAAVR